MRVQAAQIRTAGLAAAVVALLAAGVSGCSGGGSTPAAVVQPNPALGHASTGATTTPAPSASSSDPGTALPTFDASAALALKQQQVGCKAALGPLFSAVVNGTATEEKVMSVTPPAAKQVMQQSFTELHNIIAQDPAATTDGNASKAAKYLDAFCLTPAGAQFVGTTPKDGLIPPKPPKTTHR
jgi:hypothetical protein